MGRRGGKKNSSQAKKAKIDNAVAGPSSSSNESKTTTIEALSDEVIAKTLTYLDRSDLTTCRSVNVTFQKVANEILKERRQVSPLSLCFHYDPVTKQYQQVLSTGTNGQAKSLKTFLSMLHKCRNEFLFTGHYEFKGGNMKTGDASRFFIQQISSSMVKSLKLIFEHVPKSPRTSNLGLRDILHCVDKGLETLELVSTDKLFDNREAEIGEENRAIPLRLLKLTTLRMKDGRDEKVLDKIVKVSPNLVTQEHFCYQHGPQGGSYRQDKCDHQECWTIAKRNPERLPYYRTLAFAD